jgi:hypothetical protein
MKNHSIATIVNFCSNESRFIQTTLEQALLFSEQVIIPVCDHFFDGTGENRALLNQIYAAFPDCLFIEYPYLPEKMPKKIWQKVEPAHFWHSLSRLVGFAHLNEEIETVLFLDADEIPEGKRFAEWLDCSDYKQHTTLKLANYWYFRDPSNQALRFEDSVILAQKRALEFDLLMHKEERDAIYNLLPGPKRRYVAGSDGAPIFHHYSWVRTKEEMLRKVRTWKQPEGKDWEALVHEEFASGFRGTDFVRGYSYRSIPPRFDIRFEGVHFEPKGAPQVKRLKNSELLSLVKQKKFWNFLDF